jgi:hypothetical protein
MERMDYHLDSGLRDPVDRDPADAPEATHGIGQFTSSLDPLEGLSVDLHFEWRCSWTLIPLLSKP